ncbi:RNA-directed DNA polymerase [Vibrio splendidus]|uniref:retron St85 family RNA-directed DNA polymerase n=1 Tax=Vibrio splendidus TaxID=29497 RepID=UPI000D33C871|nr:retron St85 family RNA-directed DNA polymerase [Vibrio splendidus]PTP91151.1 RNA-directed DNA polymerase [Vibrio splendidus]
MTFIQRLAKELNKSRDEVEDFLFFSPEKYKVYRIPKRKHGFRVIAQPTKELKTYQRAFISLIQLPVHECAMAYCKEKSIKDNAAAHKNNKYLLKLDLENFFNSITPEIFWEVWASFTSLPSEEDRKWMEKLLFWDKQGKLVLSVGAPSSPLLSNFCMTNFDKELTSYCKKKDVSYTRYADDLTFSTNKRDALFSFPAVISEFLDKHFSSRLMINHSKTAFSSKAHNRHVTGITITNEGKLSLGRERKRYIKHKVHQFKIEKLDPYEIQHLKGLLAFAKHIEPKFIKSLNNKYSKLLIKKIFETNDD